MHSCQVRVGQVVAQGLSLYRNAFLPLLVLSSIAQAGNGALLLVYSPKALGGGLYWLLYAVAYLPLWMWIELATLFTIDRVEHGQRPSLGDIVGSPRGKFLRFLSATVRATALVIGATVGASAIALVPALSLGIVAFMTRLWILFVGVGAMVLWMLVRMALYGVLVALEPRAPQGPGPIRRSWRLMRTHIWRGLGIWLVVSLWFVPGVALSFLAFDQQSMQFQSMGLSIASLVVGALAAPVLSTTAVALYRAVKAEELS